MFQLINILHVIICIALIGLVLLQQGKGSAMGAAFGAGVSQTVFGSRGSGGFLMKVTGLLALGFFLTSLVISYLTTTAVKSARQLQLDVPTTQTPVTQQPKQDGSKQ